MKDLAQEQLDQAQLGFLKLLLDAGCKFLFRTRLFGKDYVWMKDRYGSIFLERIPAEAQTFSIDGQTGEVEQANA